MIIKTIFMSVVAACLFNSTPCYWTRTDNSKCSDYDNHNIRHWIVGSACRVDRGEDAVYQAWAYNPVSKKELRDVFSSEAAAQAFVEQNEWKL